VWRRIVNAAGNRVRCRAALGLGERNAGEDGAASDAPHAWARAVEDGGLSRIFHCFRAVYAYRRTYFALVRDCAQGGGAVGQQFRGARGRGARRTEGGFTLISASCVAEDGCGRRILRVSVYAAALGELAILSMCALRALLELIPGCGSVYMPNCSMMPIL
jgi:hypothetical protein